MKLNKQQRQGLKEKYKGRCDYFNKYLMEIIKKPLVCSQLFSNPIVFIRRVSDIHFNASMY